MMNAASLYPLLGCILLVVALLIATDAKHPSRLSSANFWALYGLIFLAGDYVPAELVGAAVVVMALIAGLGLLKAKPSTDAAVEAPAGYAMFGPALALPGLTLLAMAVVAYWPLLNAMIDPGAVTLICLAFACVVGLIWALLLTKDTPLQAARETQRLLEAMGFAVVLPQLLAVLGLVFNQTGVGQLIAAFTQEFTFLQHKAAVVVLYCSAMALFTIIMGNAFAAFPVITAGIGIPLLMIHHQANPAVVAAIGMFSGYCGTLMTPMAANFNLVPALLLNLNDQHGVIKAQLPTAASLLLVNMALMYWLAF